jgi:hypothetical protein
VDFKKMNGHAHVPQKIQTTWNIGKKSASSIPFIEKRQGLKISTQHTLVKHTLGHNVRFQELVDLKKINGHTNVPRRSGQLGLKMKLCLFLFE